jgi:hypothetical protein
VNKQLQMQAANCGDLSTLAAKCAVFGRDDDFIERKMKATTTRAFTLSEFAMDFVMDFGDEHV